MPADRSRTRCAVWAALPAAGFAVLLALVLLAPGRPGPLPLDARVDDSLHAFAVAHPGWTALNLALTNVVWGPLTMRLLSVAVAAALLLRGLRRLALWVLASCALGWALEQAVKAAVGRPRPHWAHPVDSATLAAFPSGHAVAASVACVTLVWLLRLRGVRGPRWALALAVAAVSVAGVGFTRVYLGVHWPSDVLAGWLLGAAVVAGCAAAFAPWRCCGGAPGDDTISG